MLRRFWPLVILAFLIGLLFRLGNLYDIPILRMFATISIVVAGLTASRIVNHGQGEEAEDALKTVLTDISSTWRLLAVGRARGALQRVLVLAGPSGPQVAGVCDVANFSGRRHMNRLLARATGELAAVAGRLEEQGLQFDNTVPVLIFTRRKVDPVVAELADRYHIVVANPESLETVLESAVVEGDPLTKTPDLPNWQRAAMSVLGELQG